MIYEINTYLENYDTYSLIINCMHLFHIFLLSISIILSKPLIYRLSGFGSKINLKRGVMYMEKAFEEMSFFEKVKETGPAWMAAGLNIGGATVTNSVILAAATGFMFGWVLALATLAIYFSIYVCVRLTIITNRNPIELIKNEINPVYGYVVGVAILIVNTVFFGIQVALVGNVVTTLIPGISNQVGSVIMIIAAGIFIFLPKKSASGFIQKTLQYMVYFLSLSYVVSLFVIDVDWTGFFSGLLRFTIPKTKTEVLLFTSVLGSALAINVPVIQAYASKNNGYTVKRLSISRFETVLTNIFLLFVQFAVLIVVTSTLYSRGITPTSALDAAVALEPIAGKFSTILFGLGMFGATFSTLVAETAIEAYVITEMFNWETEPSTNRFKIIQLILLIAGFTIPIMGWNPYSIVKWGGAFNATFMPIGITAWFILINKKKLVGKYKASKKLNIALAVSLLVALVTAIRFWYVTLS